MFSRGIVSELSKSAILKGTAHIRNRRIMLTSQDSPNTSLRGPGSGIMVAQGRTKSEAFCRKFALFGGDNRLPNIDWFVGQMSVLVMPLKTIRSIGSRRDSTLLVALSSIHIGFRGSFNLPYSIKPKWHNLLLVCCRFTDLKGVK